MVVLSAQATHPGLGDYLTNKFSFNGCRLGSAQGTCRDSASATGTDQIDTFDPLFDFGVTSPAEAAPATSSSWEASVDQGDALSDLLHLECLLNDIPIMNDFKPLTSVHEQTMSSCNLQTVTTSAFAMPVASNDQSFTTATVRDAGLPSFQQTYLSDYLATNELQQPQVNQQTFNMPRQQQESFPVFKQEPVDSFQPSCVMSSMGPEGYSAPNNSAGFTASPVQHYPQQFDTVGPFSPCETFQIPAVTLEASRSVQQQLQYNQAGEGKSYMQFQPSQPLHHPMLHHQQDMKSMELSQVQPLNMPGPSGYQPMHTGRFSMPQTPQAMHSPEAVPLPAYSRASASRKRRLAMTHSTSVDSGMSIFPSSPSPCSMSPSSSRSSPIYGMCRSVPPMSLASSDLALAHSSGMGSSGLNSPSKPPPSPSQLCAVCGDSAACQHYGVRTCEGCKGFFKRTVQKGSKYVCLGDKNCPVDKRRRNRCQFCRFQKCLTVGMVKEVVRTDSLKGRRGRLPSKPKSAQESPSSPPVSLITSLVRAHLDTSPDMANLNYTQYLAPGSEPPMEAERINQFFNIINASVEATRAFAERIPGFSELLKEDQELLFQSASLELFVLRMAQRTKLFETARVTFCNGMVLHKHQCESTFGEWMNTISEFAVNIHAMDMDLSAFACLCALTILSERHGLKEPAKVEQLQMKVVNSLRDHVIYNAEARSKPHYFSRILGKLSELRSLSAQGLHRIFCMKLEALFPIPPLIEALCASSLHF